MATPVRDFLTMCSQRFERSTRRFEQLVAGLSAEQAAWRPAPGRWSVAECVEHLNVTAKSYFVRLEPALRRAREQLQGDTISGRGSLLGRYILQVLDPERARRAPAPKVFRPATRRLDFDRVCEDFRAVQERFDELLELASGLDLGRVKLATPASRFIRLTAAEAFEIHVLHEERHLAQAEAVTASPEFPRDSD